MSNDPRDFKIRELLNMTQKMKHVKHPFSKRVVHLAYGTEFDRTAQRYFGVSTVRDPKGRTALANVTNLQLIVTWSGADRDMYCSRKCDVVLLPQIILDIPQPFVSKTKRRV